MKTKKVKISEVKLNPNNPRLIKDDKFAKLVESIINFPEMLEIRPIVVNSDMVVLGGNMRLKACKEAGIKEIPIIVADNLTEEQQKEFLIKDNVSGGEWDWDILANEWDIEQLTDWGLDIPVFDEQVLDAEEDDFEVPEGGIETDIVLGDLFEIGQHRLLCGDSTDSDAVAKLMNGCKSELLFTSPPYSDMRTYNGDKDVSVNKLIEFIPTFLEYAEYQVINLGLQRKDNEVVEYWQEYINKAKECGYKFLSWNVWDKMNGGSIASATAMFMLVHEWIFVFGKKHKDLNRTIENKVNPKSKREETKVRQADGSHKKTTTLRYDNHQLHSVTQCIYELGSIRSLHPATFPVKLPSEYIKAMTDINDIITEPFTGSGTTMIASHQLKRKCYGMELDPKYCQVIVDRMLKLDPNIEIKRNGVKYVKTEN